MNNGVNPEKNSWSTLSRIGTAYPTLPSAPQNDKLGAGLISQHIGK
jgi:hypothetical protein